MPENDQSLSETIVNMPPHLTRSRDFMQFLYLILLSCRVYDQQLCVAVADLLQVLLPFLNSLQMSQEQQQLQKSQLYNVPYLLISSQKPELIRKGFEFLNSNELNGSLLMRQQNMQENEVKKIKRRAFSYFIKRITEIYIRTIHQSTKKSACLVVPSNQNQIMQYVKQKSLASIIGMKDTLSSINQKMIGYSKLEEELNNKRDQYDSYYWSKEQLNDPQCTKTIIPYQITQSRLEIYDIREFSFYQKYLPPQIEQKRKAKVVSKDLKSQQDSEALNEIKKQEMKQVLDKKHCNFVWSVNMHSFNHFLTFEQFMKHLLPIILQTFPSFLDIRFDAYLATKALKKDGGSLEICLVLMLIQQTIKIIMKYNIDDKNRNRQYDYNIDEIIMQNWNNFWENKVWKQFIDLIWQDRDHDIMVMAQFVQCMRIMLKSQVELRRYCNQRKKDLKNQSKGKINKGNKRIGGDPDGDDDKTQKIDNYFQKEQQDKNELASQTQSVINSIIQYDQENNQKQSKKQRNKNAQEDLNSKIFVNFKQTAYQLSQLLVQLVQEYIAEKENSLNNQNYKNHRATFFVPRNFQPDSQTAVGIQIATTLQYIYHGIKRDQLQEYDKEFQCQIDQSLEQINSKATNTIWWLIQKETELCQNIEFGKNISQFEIAIKFIKCFNISSIFFDARQDYQNLERAERVKHKILAISQKLNKIGFQSMRFSSQLIICLIQLINLEWRKISAEQQRCRDKIDNFNYHHQNGRYDIQDQNQDHDQEQNEDFYTSLIQEIKVYKTALFGIKEQIISSVLDGFIRALPTKKEFFKQNYIFDDNQFYSIVNFFKLAKQFESDQTFIYKSQLFLDPEAKDRHLQTIRQHIFDIIENHFNIKLFKLQMMTSIKIHYNRIFNFKNKINQLEVIQVDRLKSLFGAICGLISSSSFMTMEYERVSFQLLSTPLNIQNKEFSNILFELTRCLIKYHWRSSLDYYSESRIDISPNKYDNQPKESNQNNWISSFKPLRFNKFLLNAINFINERDFQMANFTQSQIQAFKRGIEGLSLSGRLKAQQSQLSVIIFAQILIQEQFAKNVQAESNKLAVEEVQKICTRLIEIALCVRQSNLPFVKLCAQIIDYRVISPALAMKFLMVMKNQIISKKNEWVEENVKCLVEILNKMRQGMMNGQFVTNDEKRKGKSQKQKGVKAKSKKKQNGDQETNEEQIKNKRLTHIAEGDQGQEDDDNQIDL